MICIGYTAISGANSISDTIIETNNITEITLSNSKIDKLFVSRDTTLSFDEKNEVWGYDTIMLADFMNNLFAGNLQFALETVTSLRIKQRESGTFQWRTVYDEPVNSEEDLHFIKYYPYARSETMYDFAIVPVLNETIEGSLNITQCFSKFNYDFIIEKDKTIKVILNDEREQQRNKESAIVSTLGSKYPTYISNSMANYDSGSFTATFISYNESTGEFDVEKGYIYQRDVEDFLTNGNKKIFKTFYGDMWMINVIDNLERNTEHYQCPVHTINWVETGDYRSTTDMYQNNFLDVDIEIIE